MSDILIQDNIPEERRYWIYSMRVDFEHLHHDGSHEHCRRAPDGWCINGFSFKRLASKHEIKAPLSILREWCRRAIGKSAKYRKVRKVVMKAELIMRAEWWLSWFQHETFDVGQTNEDALSSFRHYVWWAEGQGKRYVRGEDGNLLYDLPVVQLMGAEDDWRWCGSEPDGENDARSDPPCRCKHCKRQGLIRIGH